jgi:branched-chain amino acid aminotransferase
VETRIYVDGTITPPDRAFISVLDHGFLLGDSVYEVLRWHRGALIQETEHMDRLEASARRTYMDLQRSREELVAAVHETCRAAGVGPDEDAYVRLVVTRGAGPLGLDVTGTRRSVVVIVAPASRPSAAAWERGLSVALVARRRVPTEALDPRAKTGNYLNNVLALHEAKLAGADDAVMLNEKGDVTEATTANAWLVRGGRVLTPTLEAGILEGTSRMRILALCRGNGIPAREGRVKPRDLKGAQEAFLSSSVRGVVPVVRVDGEPVGAGVPGPVTRRVHALFEQAADDEARRAGALRHGTRETPGAAVPGRPV